MKNKPTPVVEGKTVFMKEVLLKEEAEEIISKEKGWTFHLYNQSGPCSNYGYEIYRPATIDEIEKWNDYQDKLKKKRKTKRQEFLKTFDPDKFDGFTSEIPTKPKTTLGSIILDEIKKEVDDQDK